MRSWELKGELDVEPEIEGVLGADPGIKGIFGGDLEIAGVLVGKYGRTAVGSGDGARIPVTSKSLHFNSLQGQISHP